MPTPACSLELACSREAQALSIPGQRLLHGHRGGTEIGTETGTEPRTQPGPDLRGGTSLPPPASYLVDDAPCGRACQHVIPLRVKSEESAPGGLHLLVAAVTRQHEGARGVSGEAVLGHLQAAPVDVPLDELQPQSTGLALSVGRQQSPGPGGRREDRPQERGGGSTGPGKGSEMTTQSRLFPTQFKHFLKGRKSRKSQPLHVKA